MCIWASHYVHLTNTWYVALCLRNFTVHFTLREISTVKGFSIVWIAETKLLSSILIWSFIISYTLTFTSSLPTTSLLAGRIFASETNLIIEKERCWWLFVRWSGWHQCVCFLLRHSWRFSLLARFFAGFMGLVSFLSFAK